MNHATIVLSRGFPSLWSRPVIGAVDPRIFQLRYFQRCLSCGFCRDQCCNHGVDIDANNAERLLALGKSFEEFVGLPASQWFTAEAIADEEFPARRHFRTRTIAGRCVFHDSAGRGCKIHAWSAKHGIDYHLLKPMISVLFPLTFENGVLMPSNEVLDGSLVCAGNGASLYDGVRDELLWFFGEEFVTELDARKRDQSALSDGG